MTLESTRTHAAAGSRRAAAAAATTRAVEGDPLSRFAESDSFRAAAPTARAPVRTRAAGPQRRTARPLARHAAGQTDAESRRRRRRFIAYAVAGSLASVFLLTLLVTVAFVVQVLQVRDDLEVAQDQLGVFAEAAVSVDVERLEAASNEIVERTQRAQTTSNSVLWDLAAELPQVGNNVLAVRTVTEVVNTVTSQSLPPIVAMIAAADTGQGGAESLGIDLRPFLGVGTVLPTVISSFEEASAIASSLDRTEVLPAVYEPLDQMIGLLDRATPVLTFVQSHLPALLHAAGADRPMLYQVMIQTPAEIRATGGGVAQWLVLEVDNGRVNLLGQENGVDLMYITLPSLGFDTVNGSLIDLSDDTRSLYPFEVANWSSNFTMTPHFPRAVELFQATREWTEDRPFDGAISIDPLVLAHLLEATGPLTLASGETVDSENTAALLMSEPYERFGTDNAAMDAFFTEVTTAMFDTLTGGEWEFSAIWDQLTRSADEGRVLLWFEDERLEALAHEYGLDGVLREDNTEATQLGIYFNDYSVGKLNYHMDYTQSATCNADERTITVTMDINSTITEDIKSPYTLGLRNLSRGIDPRTMMLDVLFFAPPGGEILWTTPEEGDWWDPRFRDRSGVDHGNSAISRSVLLPMGESRTVSYEVKLPDGELGPLELRHTPGANDTEVTVDASCGALFGSPEGSHNLRLSTIG